MSRTTNVATSSLLAMRSDRYGCVKTKSKVNAETTARRRTGDASADDRREQHRNDERERHVGVRQVVAEGYERTGDHERAERTDRGSHGDVTVSGVPGATPQEIGVGVHGSSTTKR